MQDAAGGEDNLLKIKKTLLSNWKRCFPTRDSLMSRALLLKKKR